MARYENLTVNKGRIEDLYLGSDNGSLGVQVTATAAEINAACDVTAGAVVSLTGTVSLTAALHAGKVCTLDAVAGFTTTLPEATGTGHVYTLIVGTALTSNTYVVATPDIVNSDMVGNVVAKDLDGSTADTNYESIQATGNNTYTMNMTTTGGVNIGTDWVRFTDMGTDLWQVEGRFLVPTGSNPATPFSVTT